MKKRKKKTTRKQKTIKHRASPTPTRKAKGKEKRPKPRAKAPRKNPAGMTVTADAAFGGPAPEPRSLPKLVSILEQYHRPVPPEAKVRPMVPNFDILAADLNEAWAFPEGKEWRGSETGNEWMVRYLARQIDGRMGWS